MTNDRPGPTLSGSVHALRVLTIGDDAVTVTNLEAARVAKQLGVPLTTPMVDIETSAPVLKHWRALAKATAHLETAADDWLATATRPAPRVGKWSLLNRRVGKLREVASAADAYLGKIAGCGSDAKALTNEKIEAMNAADPSIRIIVDLAPRAMDLVNFWQEFINGVADSKPGDQLDIAHLFNAPKVFTGDFAPGAVTS